VDTLTKPNKKHRINYALAATMIAGGVTLPEAAKRLGAASATSLRVGLARKGVTITGIRKESGNVDRIQAVAVKCVSQASEALKAQFSDILAKHGEALSKVPAKRNLTHIRKVGEAFEPLARIGKIVHDWGSSQSIGLISIGAASQVEQAEQPAIEIGTPQENPPALCSSPPPEGETKP
jgi:hypothetical protein